MDLPADKIIDIKYMYRQDKLFCSILNNDYDVIVLEVTDELCKKFNKTREDIRLEIEITEKIDIEIAEQNATCNSAQHSANSTPIPSTSGGAEYTHEEEEYVADVQGKGKTIWIKHQIEALLDAYKNRKEMMRSSQFKNDFVWRTISADLLVGGISMSAEQCKFKFFNLKKKFVQTKDNNSKTGSAHKRFAFEEQFAEIFAKNHAVEPLTVEESGDSEAPTPRKRNLSEESSDATDSNSGLGTPCPSKRKCRCTQERILDYMRESDSKNEMLRAEKESRKDARLGKGKTIWIKHQIEALLDAYKNRKEMMRSSQFKNDFVWRTISADLLVGGISMSAEQCKFKFFNLKKKFVQTKDNNSKTGSAHKRFAFEEQFAEIFAKNHAVEPLTIEESGDSEAPTPRKRNLSEESSDATDSNSGLGTPCPSKRKCRCTQERILDYMRESDSKNEMLRAEKESRKDARLEKMVNVINESTSSFNRLMEKLIEKL